MSDKQYDVLVVGAGSAGQSVATAAARAGRSVAMTEGRAYGGTCPLRGCDPKLVLHAAAEAVHRVQRLSGKGFTAAPGFHWPDLMAWKRSFTEPMPEKARTAMREAGIDVYDDYASFVDDHTLSFGGVHLRGKTIVLATGMRPAPLDFPGHEHMLTSDEFLDLEELPDEMVVVGAGYIGTEVAHISHALGCRVTVVASGPVPLEKFDPDLTDLLRQADEDRGMTYHLNSRAVAVRPDDGRFVVTIEDAGGRRTEIRTDRVIHCAGRVPNTDRLNLEAAGINTDDQGRIKVNDQLQTNLAHVYAVGDCTNVGLPLTPVAGHAASVLSDHLFKVKDRPLELHPTPTVAFALPGMAAVGMTAAEAAASPRNIGVHYKVSTDWFHPRHRNAAVSAFKLFTDDDRGVVVGAHLLGPDASELINLLYVAIRQEIPIRELKRMVFAYPTAASMIPSMIDG
ncbi:glutathione reductase (NADPH) [Lewinella marina]|uniref:Pyridine nucleotide-disulfide oxidoreductase n=1 Tax=Neolewinella marina TaxID=438751 RepID=A0A2G0CJ09_9BACT|nr:NAD(P)/FAD-dependent oxidoreductase [Neolewinella marina]NJB84873.1 glutathione reductase (NADPH) [Neolewinella marina]PHK99973.1 pyridine nucleotide-disulfide oxidoreductase [Neolewinella marina]